MPGIDGHEVLRRIKGAEKLKRLPVIILTSSSDEGDRAMSYDNGANSYLVKPVSFDEFSESRQTCLRLLVHVKRRTAARLNPKKKDAKIWVKK